MTEHRNATLVRRGYDAFIKGDTTTLKEIFAPNVTWHQPHTGLIAGDYVGLDHVFEYFSKLSSLTAGTYHVDPLDILADDERALVLQHSEAKRDGKTLDTRQVLVFEIRKDAVVDVRLYASDEQAESEFWS